MLGPSDVGELKAQGVAEASRDPDSNVTAEDAEKKFVAEAQKSGGQAFMFDPNASPEEKAAQARARQDPLVHHDKKPQGVAVATDIDDGTPDQYDLPPPDAGAAIPVSPSTADDPKAAHANGHLPEDENARWVERVGWAPRFGSGGNDAEAGDMLDHETWLEGKLEDKLFGDWYHNTGIIIFACLSSWLAAVFGGGLGWVFIILAFCGTYYRTSIRRVRRNFRDDVHREMAKARLETDTESLEWINSFMAKFWPIYAPVLAETVINSVDQVLSSTPTPPGLESLSMKSFILGTKPPRLEHVKTYPKAEDDIVLMDWKFSFTPNDTSDLTARQIKDRVNPKIILEVRVGKAMISKGLDIIVEDFAFSGLMRVKFKLQLPFPHIDRVEICFLERPTIDYVCKPLGGESFGFDINFVPMLKGFILEMIHGSLQPIMYDPNVFPIEVAKMLAGNPVDQAIGIIAVTLHGANGLKNSDKFGGTPDPYTIISLNNRDELARTNIVKENANPRWNETKYIIVTSLKDALTLQVYDFNEYRKDKDLGTAAFALEKLETQAEYENEQVEVMANGRGRGAIVCDIRFFPVLEGRKLEDGTIEPPPESNTGIARFCVEQAKDLDGTKSLVGKLSPYGVLLLNGKEVHTTKKLKRTNNPIWDNGYKEILITDRTKARLGLVIKDDRDLGGDQIIGQYQIRLNDMLQMMEKGQEWYHLAGAKTGRAKLTLQWKPVALKGAVGGSGGYVTPIGVMRLHFVNARDIKNVETVGKSDPYVRVLLSGVEKGRTVTFQNNLNPDWDEVLYVPMHTNREKLTLEVMDEENLGKDRSLGSVELAASDYIFQGDNGEYLVHDEKKPLASPLRARGTGSPKGTLNYTCSFYPCLNVADPEEEEEERAEKEKLEKELAAREGGTVRKSMEKDAIAKENERKSLEKVDKGLAKALDEGEQEQEETTEEKVLPKIRITPEDLVKYESGFIIFKVLDVELQHANCLLESQIDDMRFPSYVSSRIRSKSAKLDDMGDTFVRELDFSKITLRLKEKQDSKGAAKEDNTLAKLVGSTLDTLKQCLNNPTVLIMKSPDGGVNKVRVSMKYIPVRMSLDPSESINNMGNLRVDILDATDLPAADRNGFSDPYCKFNLNGKDVFKTGIQKKTLHPAWNEFFEVPVPSRTAAHFKVKVYDWDIGDKDDFLGEADINLELLDPFQPKEYNLQLDGKSGSVRLRCLFKPEYVTRSRQGSSTFSGTFATPGKVISGVAGAPIKGVGMVGGGVLKGASFIGRGFKSKKKNESNGSLEPPELPSSAESTPLKRSSNLEAGPPPGTPDGRTPPHNRSSSFGGQSFISVAGKGVGGAETGSAGFTILSASGYPPAANVRVIVKQLGAKGSKDVHKSKAIKSPTGMIQWEHETFNLNCAADTQFQVHVVDHATIGRDHDLSEPTAFFIDDSASGGEKVVKAGEGSVIIRTKFTPADAASMMDSPKGRRSFLSKKDPRSERAGTPS